MVHQHLNELMTLNTFFKGFLDVGVVGLLGGMFKVYNSIKAKDEMLEKINSNQEIIKRQIADFEVLGAKREAASIACLHDRIYENYETILSRKPSGVTMKELDNISYLWSAYHDLGGNGTGENMYHRICELPIIEEEPHEKH